jgi:hypothetical protein
VFIYMNIVLNQRNSRAYSLPLQLACLTLWLGSRSPSLMGKVGARFSPWLV